MDPSSPSHPAQLVTFRVDGRVLALALDSVVRVERAAAVTPLPGGPPCLMGALNHHGRLLPVLDLRRRLHLPTRDLDTEDQFLLVRCGLRTVVVPVDRVEGIVEAGPLVAPDEVVGAPLGVEGLMASEDGLIIVQEADRLLNPAEEAAWEAAVAGAGTSSSETSA